METNKYKLRYLPLFEYDLSEVYHYIRDILCNEKAADRLVDNIEKSILERLKMPLSFEPYKSSIKRKYPYYRIYVGNYTVFYVVIDKVMEVRRLIYSKRNIDEILPNDEI